MWHWIKVQCNKLILFRDDFKLSVNCIKENTFFDYNFKTLNKIAAIVFVGKLSSNVYPSIICLLFFLV